MALHEPVMTVGNELRSLINSLHLRSKKIKFLLPKHKHRSAHYKARQKPQSSFIKEAQETCGPWKTQPKPRLMWPLPSLPTESLRQTRQQSVVLAAQHSRPAGQVADQHQSMPSPAPGAGRQGHLQEAEEQECVCGNFHIFRKGGKKCSCR